MATNVTVWAEQTAVAVDVPAGSTQYWTTTGGAAEWGRYVTYVAHPLRYTALGGTNAFKVHDVSHGVNNTTGTRHIKCQVTNVGTAPYGSYALYLVFTDVIPS
jgi:hypothetical protein